MGLVKKPNTDNQALAKMFMDWFLSTSIQNKIPESQWMYPANAEAQIPACFTQASLDPSSVTALNNFLTPSHLRAFLQPWMDEWEQMVVTQGLPGFDTSMVFISFPFLSILFILRKKRNN